MDLYIVYTTDVAQIDFDPDFLAAKCSASFPGHYDCYQPSAFARYSGFTRTVGEEINFVLQAQQYTLHGQRDCHIGYLNATDFASQWALAQWTDHQVDHLSGGWSKFLSVALFTHLHSDIKLYADVTRQLSDKLIKLFIHNLLLHQPARKVIFWELDCNRLSRFYSNLKPLYDLGDRVDTNQWVLGKTWHFGDSNFGYGVH